MLMKRILSIFLVSLWFTSCQESPLEDSISEVTTENELYLILPTDTKYAVIISPASPLTPIQKQYLLESLYSLEMKYPELDEIIDYILKYRGSILFKMNPKLNAEAAYDLSTIEFQREAFIEDERLLEEILHVAQDIYYGYDVMRNAEKNIEFEVRALRDIWEFRRVYLRNQELSCTYRGINSNEYVSWITIIGSQNINFVDISKFNTFVNEWDDPFYMGLNLPYDPNFSPRFLKSYANTNNL